ncbi:MAG: hypothetical protein AAGM22_16320 [Acidobacteriota bacterium]
MPRPDRVLIEGASTGHRHEFADGTPVKLYELSGEIFVRVLERPARLVHREHGPIDLEPGCYRAWRQREYQGLGFSAPVLD